METKVSFKDCYKKVTRPLLYADVVQYQLDKIILFCHMHLLFMADFKIFEVYILRKGCTMQRFLVEKEKWIQSFNIAQRINNVIQ